MAGTSISSSEKKEYYVKDGNYITTETVVTAEKVEDFLSSTHEKEQLDDLEKTSSSVDHTEDLEDSPIEEVRAVVSK
jgi:hypothetical protein